MFTLKRLKAKNFIGFKAGLTKKVIELDFSDMLWKSVYLIMGDNGSGKSTLASILMPVHVPYNTSGGFIVPGEEGYIEREYITEDGSLFLTRCVYKPDKDDPKKFKTSAFFGVINSDGEYVEYGNGGIEVYYDLLKKHLSFDKSVMDWIYYDDDNGKSIVKMTDKERIDSISKHIKANRRFVNPFNNANDKLKIYRNTMKSTINKINSLRPTKVLQQSMDTIETYLKTSNIKKESLLKEIAKLEAQIEMYGSVDSEELNDEVIELSQRIDKLSKAITPLKYVESYDVTKLRMEAEKTKIECESFIKNSRVPDLRDRQYSLYETLEDLENSVDFNKEDYDTLKEHVHELNEKLNKLKYCKNPSKYNNMSYSECELVDEVLVRLVDEYRELESVTSGYLYEYDPEDTDLVIRLSNNLSILIDKIAVLKDELSELNKTVHRLEGSIDNSFSKSMKPKECNVPTCVFIMKMNENEDKEKNLDRLRVEINQKQTELDNTLNAVESLDNKLKWIQAIGDFVDNVNSNSRLLEKYLNVSNEKLINSIFNGKFIETVDFKIIREYLSILSEKEVYINLKYEKIPKIENKLKMYEMQIDNANRIEKEIAKTNAEIEKVNAAIAKESEAYTKMSKLLIDTKDLIESYDEMIEDKNKLDSYLKELSELVPSYEKNRDVLVKVSSSERILKDLKRSYNELCESIAKVEKDRELIGYELLQTIQLNTELMELEQKFLIADVIVSMIKPGQKMMKDSTDMFLDDIVDMTNVLLTKVMDGKLMLAPFEIDDGVFDIPFVFNGNVGDDIKYGSSAQRSIVDKCLGLALLAKIVSDVGVIVMDEPDSKLSPKIKAKFIHILVDFLKYIGIRTSFIISHNPDNFKGHDVGYIIFPGAEVPDDTDDYILL